MGGGGQVLPSTLCTPGSLYRMKWEIGDKPVKIVGQKEKRAKMDWIYVFLLRKKMPQP